ncbi:MAG TPA: response regulator [Thermoanaerobaculia bacterium]|nr:response regulator [Thermoanaerobaculia bacterium]
MKKEIILILDDDLGITEALALALEAEHRTIVTCCDVAAAQLVIEKMPISLLLTDIRLTGSFAFEGLELIDHVRRHSPSTRIALMTGAPSTELRLEAIRRGALAVFNKPFEIDDVEDLILSTESVQ